MPKDLADIGGDIGPGDRGVIGDDPEGELGRMMAENLCCRSGDKARGALGMP